jgi:hypothetical protein
MRRGLFGLFLGLELAGARAPVWRWPAGVAAPTIPADNAMSAAPVDASSERAPVVRKQLAHIADHESCE